MTQQLSYRAKRSAVFYQPPRSFNFIRMVCGSSVAIPLLIAFAFAYIRALDQFRGMYLRFGACAALGIAGGAVTISVLKFAQVQSRALGILVGCALGFITLYAAWVWWLRDIASVFARSNVPAWKIVEHPLVAWNLVRAIAPVGTWSLQHDVISGGPLAFIWICEALILVAIPGWMGTRGVSDLNPVCKTCNVPTRRQSKMPCFAALKPAQFIANIVDWNFDASLQNGPLLDDDDPQLNLELFCCPSCDNTNVLSVKHVAWYVNKQGKRHVQIKILLNRMLIPHEQSEIVKGLRARLETIPVAQESDPIEEEST